MRRLLLLRRMSCGLILIIMGYHIIFGTIRLFSDFWCPAGWCDNTVVAFGLNLRSVIFSVPTGSDNWVLRDMQPEKQQADVSGFRLTCLDENVYDYEVEMGWFYKYEKFYVYGRNGFWIIQAEPFHIKLLRSKNASVEESQELSKVIVGYNNILGDQFTVVNAESDLTRDEQRAYARVKEKAQPRIKTLKAQGLFP